MRPFSMDNFNTLIVCIDRLKSFYSSGIATDLKYFSLIIDRPNCGLLIFITAEIKLSVGTKGFSLYAMKAKTAKQVTSQLNLKFLSSFVTILGDR